MGSISVRRRFLIIYSHLLQTSSCRYSSLNPAWTLALASPVGERIVRAQREGLERFAECAYLLVSGLRSAALRAIERGEDVSRSGSEGKAVFKAVLNAAYAIAGPSNL